MHKHDISLGFVDELNPSKKTMYIYIYVALFVKAKSKKSRFRLQFPSPFWGKISVVRNGSSFSRLSDRGLIAIPWGTQNKIMTCRVLKGRGVQGEGVTGES